MNSITAPEVQFYLLRSESNVTFAGQVSIALGSIVLERGKLMEFRGGPLHLREDRTAEENSTLRST